MLRQLKYLHSSEYALNFLLCQRHFIIRTERYLISMCWIFCLTMCCTLLCGILKWVLQTHRLVLGHNWGCHDILIVSEEETLQANTCSFTDWMNLPFHHITQQLLKWVKLSGSGEADVEGVGGFSSGNPETLQQVKPPQSRQTARCSQAARPCWKLVLSEMLQCQKNLWVSSVTWDVGNASHF